VRYHVVDRDHLSLLPEELLRRIREAQKATDPDVKKHLGSMQFAYMAVTGEKSHTLPANFDNPIPLSKVKDIPVPPTS